MTMIYAIHPTNADHLATVTAEMETLGAPPPYHPAPGETVCMTKGC